MMNYTDQLQRIKDKLRKAKLADKNLEVFGADSHKYVVKKPATLQEVAAFEAKYAIELPGCYKAFVLELGNGGVGRQNAAAGPFYGIFPLGEHVDELVCEGAEQYLHGGCVIAPQMSDEAWEILTMSSEVNEAVSDEAYSQALGKLWAGILPIGSQGCTYLHGIVLNGPFKGRVVNVDMDRQKPQFAHEVNFLDWYERWLDEVVSGELIGDASGWFGYSKGGPEDNLLASFIDAKSAEEKKINLDGLLNKKRLADQTLNQIEQLIKREAEPQNTLVQLLCKSNYEKAKPYLRELVKTDLCSVFRFVYSYAPEKSAEWITVIEENASRIDDSETFRFSTYLLQETNTDVGRIVEPFTRNSNEHIRSQAFYSLGKLKNKKAYLECFIEGLKDSSNRVVHSTLQALTDVHDKKLLIYYQQIAERFPEEQDYILSNLNHLLAKYGLNNKTILSKKIVMSTSADVTPKKKWYEIWK